MCEANRETLKFQVTISLFYSQTFPLFLWTDYAVLPPLNPVSLAFPFTLSVVVATLEDPRVVAGKR